MTETHDHRGGRGAVVLDIGAGHGALVLLADAGMEGVEIEISPVGRDGRRQHVAVLRRPLPNGHAYAAVYSPLPAGDYRIWRSDGTAANVVHVAGGRVTQTAWPDRAAGRAPTGPSREQPDPGSGRPATGAPVMPEPRPADGSQSRSPI